MPKSPSVSVDLAFYSLCKANNLHSSFYSQTVGEEMGEKLQAHKLLQHPVALADSYILHPCHVVDWSMLNGVLSLVFCCIREFLKSVSSSSWWSAFSGAFVVHITTPVVWYLKKPEGISWRFWEVTCEYCSYKTSKLLVPMKTKDNVFIMISYQVQSKSTSMSILLYSMYRTHTGLKLCFSQNHRNYAHLTITIEEDIEE